MGSSSVSLPAWSCRPIGSLAGGIVPAARGPRQHRANTARGAAHFPRETVGRVRHGGAKGQLTVRTDSGFHTHAVVAV